VGATELGDRVVAVAEEDPLVELRCTLALGAVEGPAGGANTGRSRFVKWGARSSCSSALKVSIG